LLNPAKDEGVTPASVRRVVLLDGAILVPAVLVAVPGEALTEAPDPFAHAPAERREAPWPEDQKHDHENDQPMQTRSTITRTISQCTALIEPI
jgi:hypothetical protein